jgi:hypothetical protein
MARAGTDKDPGEWGGHTTLRAAANAYGRTLHVVSAPPVAAAGGSYHATVAPNDAQGDGGLPDVWLAYLNGNHYRATRLLDGFTTTTDCPTDAVRTVILIE